jgi:hypothetical protein
MSGKGSRPRPLSVDRDQYDKSWDRIFNKDQNTIDEIARLVAEVTLSPEESFENINTKREK